MARTRRVRDLCTDALVEELGQLFCSAAIDNRWNPKMQQRWSRVAREVARRDYRFRPHGRRCTCADCTHLLEVWASLGRRSDPLPDDFDLRD